MWHPAKKKKKKKKEPIYHDKIKTNRKMQIGRSSLKMPQVVGQQMLTRVVLEPAWCALCSEY